jgi:hypothetical protein
MVETTHPKQLARLSSVKRALTNSAGLGECTGIKSVILEAVLIAMSCTLLSTTIAVGGGGGGDAILFLWFTVTHTWNDYIV